MSGESSSQNFTSGFCSHVKEDGNFCPSLMCHAALISLVDSQCMKVVTVHSATGEEQSTQIQLYRDDTQLNIFK